MTQPSQAVRRRHVFFISGFDPKGASHYHALYRAQASQQSAVNGMSMQVGPRRPMADGANGNSSWTIEAVSPEARHCETTYEFARWDDIVRRHWPRSTLRLLLDMVFAYWLMLASGVVPAIWKLSRKALIGAAYPIMVLGSGLVVGIGLGLWAALGLHGHETAGPLAFVAFLLPFGLVLWGTRYIESRLNTTWLVRIFSFTGKLAQGQTPGLEARLDALGLRIANKMRAKEADEILVVGFSVGSILAVSAMARALKRLEGGGTGATYPVLSLLTLGHCIPMLGLLPQASVFREELGVLAQTKCLTWFDFSSPTDWGSFALVDPVAACEVELPKSAGHKVQLRSPRFHTMFAPAVYAAIRRNKRRLHLQYLMAGDSPTDYDYFAVTAGAQTLGDRFADR